MTNAPIPPAHSDLLNVSRVALTDIKPCAIEELVTLA